MLIFLNYNFLLMSLPQGRSFHHNIHNLDFITIESEGRQQTQSRGTFTFGSIVISLNLIAH